MALLLGFALQAAAGATGWALAGERGWGGGKELGANTFNVKEKLWESQTFT